MGDLILGWKTTDDLAPQYWLRESAKPGSQSDDDLVGVPAKDAAAHTVIIGQSGSGKSAFLGRYLEELAMQSLAKFTVLDPNADFARFHEVQAENIWEEAGYNPQKRAGRLPHEGSRDLFSEDWSNVDMRILTANSLKWGGAHEEMSPYQPLRFWWPSLSADFMAEELDSMQSTELYHCHTAVQAIAYLAVLESAVKSQDIDPIRLSKEIFRTWNTSGRLMNDVTPEETANNILGQRFDIESLVRAVPEVPQPIAKLLELTFNWGNSVKHDPDVDRITINIWRDTISKSLQYVSQAVANFYFAKADEYIASGIVTPTPIDSHSDSKQLRLTIIDLPSVADREKRLLATDAILRDIWTRRRADWELALRFPPEEDFRVPMFVVLDEAHNLIPAEPRGKAEIILREQFRTIAAEGRKFGMFLILATQRPDKIDPMVLSECENKALMRLNSRSVLNLTTQLLGLQEIDPEITEKSLDPGIGRALLVGPWSQEVPTWVYSAARRTVEGGRNLDADFWTMSPF